MSSRTLPYPPCSSSATRTIPPSARTSRPRRFARRWAIIRNWPSAPRCAYLGPNWWSSPNSATPRKYKIRRRFTRCCSTGSRLLNDSIAQRVAGDVRIRFEIHFFQYPGPVGTHRLDAQVQFLRDVAHAGPAGQLAENLQLTRRKLGMQRLVGVVFRFQVACHRLGERVAHVPAPIPNDAHRLQYLLRLAGLR